jgi:hypothetical protein
LQEQPDGARKVPAFQPRSDVLATRTRIVRTRVEFLSWKMNAALTQANRKIASLTLHIGAINSNFSGALDSLVDTID